MDKMREEFEEWISHYIGESWLKPDTSRAGEYFDNNTQSMWESWQASRSALCVELPEWCYGDVRLSCVVDSLDEAGVSYK